LTEKRPLWQTKKAYLFILPCLGIFLFFFLYPIVYSVGLATTDTTILNILTGGKNVGFHNFEELIIGGGLYSPLIRTLLFLVTSVALKTIVGLAFATFFNSNSIRFRGTLTALMLIPWALPSMLSILIWKGMFSVGFGAVNQVLGTIGFPAVNWLGDTTNAFVAYNIVEVWLAYPFMMTVILAAMRSISPELHESAMIDGAGSLNRLRHITLPLIKKPLSLAIIMTSLTSFMAFAVPYLLNQGGPARTNEFLMVYGYNEAFSIGRYGYAAAFMILVFIMLIALTVILVRVTKLVEKE
jgi:arabinogalactan oligomer/maltooligosaccharide transport system permease protein